VEITGNTIPAIAKASATTIRTLARGLVTIPFVAEVKIGWTSVVEMEIRLLSPEAATDLVRVSDQVAVTGLVLASDQVAVTGLVLACGPVAAIDLVRVSDLEVNDRAQGNDQARGNDRAQVNGLWAHAPVQDSGLPVHVAAAMPSETSGPVELPTCSPAAGTRASAVVAEVVSAVAAAAVFAVAAVVASEVAVVAVSAAVAGVAEVAGDDQISR
jgi:hypothetical protein